MVEAAGFSVQALRPTAMALQGVLASLAGACPASARSLAFLPRVPTGFGSRVDRRGVQ